VIKTRVKSFKYRVGKNHFLVIKINQSVTARAHLGNVLASNALNVKIFKRRNHH
jgi:hypothetical protein